jgi:hypothetical protein
MAPEAPNGSQEPVTLEAVKSRFDHWRATRQKRGKTPEALWEDVRELSKSYGLRELSSSLGITYAQLHVHLEEGVQKNNLYPPSESDFINAAMPFTQNTPHHLPQWSLPPSHGILEIQGRDGINIKASGLNPQDLVALVQTFFQRELV